MTVESTPAPDDLTPDQADAPAPDDWGRPCTLQRSHDLTECSGYHLDDSDT